MRIGVPGRRDRSRHGFAFRNDELEFAVRRYADAEKRDRSGLDVEFNTCSGARLAVIFLQTAEHRLAVRNIQVMRSVVTDKHRSAIEVDRMEFGEASADI